MHGLVSGALDHQDWWFSSTGGRHNSSRYFLPTGNVMVWRAKKLPSCFVHHHLWCFNTKNSNSLLLNKSFVQPHLTHPSIFSFHLPWSMVKLKVSNAKIKLNFSPSFCSTSPLPLPIFFSPLLMRGWLPTVSWVCGPSAHDPLAAASWNPPTTYLQPL